MADLEALEKQLEATEDPDQRRSIRQKIIDIKKKKREETEKSLADLADKRDKRISDKLHEANQQKDRAKATYDEMAKTGGFNYDVYTKGGPSKK